LAAGLYQEDGHGSLEKTSRSRVGLLIGARRRRPPSTTNVLLSLIPLGSGTAPLPPFRVVPIVSLLPYLLLVDQSLLYGLFNFALQLLYILGAGSHLLQARLRRSPQTSSFLYFCIVNSSHSFPPPPPHIPIE
jgi:hypothetical protein